MSRKWMSICLTALSALAMHFTFAATAYLWISNSIIPALPAIGLFVWLIQGRWCKRRLGISASAPTFVYVNIWFLWAIYIFLLRMDVGPVMGVAFNTQCLLLSIGLWRMLCSDPGYVRNENISLESMDHTTLTVTGNDKSNFMGHFIGTGANFQNNFDCRLHVRTRLCKKCQAYVNRFDHHCPAFGNCVGQLNHRLFILLLIAFVSSEICYFLCAISWFSSVKNLLERQTQASHLVPWIISSSLFAIIQVFWQVPFFFWHLYCICLNITTDEWVNWEKYPEFQVETPPEPGRPFPGRKFKNPYNKGIVQNMVAFLKSKA
ncbi:uncharacterized protein LOC131071145 isoform X2 [Cryptomeria japonica]|uniref:uncharacterized protein LOC131071145 isoform X2 n=1 Tax=Cryptomeria japonica TaxID=3369 RepID=UPI0027DA8853|nr:uncharacterized protein LOC131071145 isoform X2 [Cryptomeria japonica]